MYLWCRLVSQYLERRIKVCYLTKIVPITHIRLIRCIYHRKSCSNETSNYVAIVHFKFFNIRNSLRRHLENEATRMKNARIWEIWPISTSRRQTNGVGVYRRSQSLPADSWGFVLVCDYRKECVVRSRSPCQARNCTHIQYHVRATGYTRVDAKCDACTQPASMACTKDRVPIAAIRHGQPWFRGRYGAAIQKQGFVEPVRNPRPRSLL